MVLPNAAIDIAAPGGMIRALGRRRQAMNAAAASGEHIVQHIERIPPRHERAPKQHDSERREHPARPQHRRDERDHPDDARLDDERGRERRARGSVGFVEALLHDEVAIDARRHA